MEFIKVEKFNFDSKEMERKEVDILKQTAKRMIKDKPTSLRNGDLDKIVSEEIKLEELENCCEFNINIDKVYAVDCYSEYSFEQEYTGVAGIFLTLEEAEKYKTTIQEKLDFIKSEINSKNLDLNDEDDEDKYHVWRMQNMDILRWGNPIVKEIVVGVDLRN